MIRAKKAIAPILIALVLALSACTPGGGTPSASTAPVSYAGYDETRPRAYPLKTDANVAVLIDASGAVLGEYTSVEEVAQMGMADEQYFEAYNDRPYYKVTREVSGDTKFAVADPSGALMTDFVYDEVGRQENDMVSVVQGGKYGTISAKDGKVIVPIEQTGEPQFAGSVWGAVNGPDEGYFINRQGERLEHRKYDEVAPFSEGLAAVMRSGLYGYINEEGKRVIDNKYHAAGPFTNGFAAISNEIDKKGTVKYGYIDSGNNLVIPLEYEYSTDLLPTVGTVEFKRSKNSPKRQGYVGIKDDKLTLLTQTDYGFCEPFHYGWGVLSKSGDPETLMDAQGKLTPIKGVGNIYPLTETNFMATTSTESDDTPKLFGIIDAEGNWIKAPEYLDLNPNGGRLLVAKKDVDGRTLCGLIDLEMNERLPMKFDDVLRTDGVLALVQSGSEYGYVNMQGEWVYRTNVQPSP